MSEIPIFKFALREDLINNVEFLPTRAEQNATGWDVRAAFKDRKPLIIKPFDYVKIPLGIRGFLPEGWWYELKPRSSSFAKKHLHCLYGTIDNDFENQLMFATTYLPPVISGLSLENYILSNQLTIDFGEAIGQIIPVKRQEMIVDSISNEEYEILTNFRQSKRGTGGFGSSGK